MNASTLRAFSGGRGTTDREPPGAWILNWYCGVPTHEALPPRPTCVPVGWGEDLSVINAAPIQEVSRNVIDCDASAELETPLTRTSTPKRYAPYGWPVVSQGSVAVVLYAATVFVPFGVVSENWYSGVP